MARMMLYDIQVVRYIYVSLTRLESDSYYMNIDIYHSLKHYCLTL